MTAILWYLLHLPGAWWTPWWLCDFSVLISKAVSWTMPCPFIRFRLLDMSRSFCLRLWLQHVHSGYINLSSAMYGVWHLYLQGVHLSGPIRPSKEPVWDKPSVYVVVTIVTGTCCSYATCWRGDTVGGSRLRLLSICWSAHVFRWTCSSGQLQTCKFQWANLCSHSRYHPCLISLSFLWMPFSFIKTFLAWEPDPAVHLLWQMHLVPLPFRHFSPRLIRSKSGLSNMGKVWCYDCQSYQSRFYEVTCHSLHWLNINQGSGKIHVFFISDVVRSTF